MSLYKSHPLTSRLCWYYHVSAYGQTSLAAVLLAVNSTC